MTARRWPATLAVGVVVALAVAAELYWLRAHGFRSAGNLDLAGRAILAEAGLMSLGQIATTYPPIPFVLAVGLTWALPDFGLAAPALLTLAVVAALAGAWFSMFREAGLGAAVAFVCVCLLAFNPLFLRVVSEGPGAAFLAAGLWLVALGMLGLRSGLRVNDVILIGVGLIILVFSHPVGPFLALASLPFLALVIPPALVARSISGAMMALAFPAIFCIASFAYAGAIVYEGPLSFTDSISADRAALGFVGEAGTGASVALAIAGLVAGAPVVPALAGRARDLPPVVLAIVALAGTLASGLVLAWLFGVVPVPAVFAGLACPLAASALLFWPTQGDARRVATTLPLLALGVFGGVLVVAADATPETVRWRTAALGGSVPVTVTAAGDLAETLAPFDDIVMDTLAAPAVFAIRGSAAGFVGADTTRFRRMQLGGAIDGAALVVRNPKGVAGPGLIGRLYPDLFADGAPGYRLLRDGERWRVYIAKDET